MRFKPIFQERAAIRVLKRLLKRPISFVVKIYIHYESTEELNWKKAEKWFISHEQYQRVSELILESEREKEIEEARVRDICSVCLENEVEKRVAKCKVRVRQHGFCTLCMSLWLSSNSTCPVCRSEVSGDSARARLELLLHSVHFLGHRSLQSALHIICHMPG